MENRVEPRWLKAMLEAQYYIPCPLHNKQLKNFCVDCVTGPLCFKCLNHHRGHQYIMIRRDLCHAAVRAREIEKHLNISRVETHTRNRIKLVYLNKLGEESPFCYNGHNLLPAFQFCSLGCKLNGIERGCNDLRFSFVVPNLNEPIMVEGDVPNEPDPPAVDDQLSLAIGAENHVVPTTAASSSFQHMNMPGGSTSSSSSRKRKDPPS